MDRTDVILTPEAAPWLTLPEVQRVCDAITAGGHQIYFVGGCVRNALLNEAVSDIDLSTDARPEVVIRLAEGAGLKAVPTGIDHGTVTVVSKGLAFEITTFRRDVETDGRRAVVAFSDDIADDARRRDFTINALYATPEGVVVDPLGGRNDLDARRIRFIDDAKARIREDFLRILRFFRFHAWYAAPDQGFDPDALAAISSNIDGLETLSAERVGAELKKLLAAPDPSFAVAGMRQTGVLSVVLPGADDRYLAPVVHLEQTLDLPKDALLRLASLGGEGIGDKLRLSKAETRDLELLREIGFVGPGLPELAYRYGRDTATQVLVLRSAMSEQPPIQEDLARISAAASQTFPVTATDLMPDYTGPALGRRLATLEAAWIASDFSLSQIDLLELPDS